MKISEITENDVANYLRLDDYETGELQPYMTVATKFIEDYTGIPSKSDDTTVETLDDHEDFWIVYMVLCQDMYDNRSYYVDKTNINRVVSAILNMHCRNFIA